jgi:hypothetical protein
VIKEIQSLVDDGFAIHWLKPRSKAPIGDDWSKKPVASLDALKQQYRDGMNVGVRLGKWSKIDGKYLHCIDLDVRDADFAEEAWDCLKDLFKKVKISKFPIVISGSGGESRHIYFVTDREFPSKKLAYSDDRFVGKDGKKHRFWEIELFGTGKQVAIPPSIHPETGKKYRWERAFDLEFDGLPLISSRIIEDLVGESEEDELDSEILGITLEEAEETLRDLPLDHWCDDRDGWLHLGMALHHEFEGSSAAFKLWNKFSKKSEKYDGDVQRQSWRHFKLGRKNPIRMATIIQAARDAHYRAELLTIQDEFDDLEEPESEQNDEKSHTRIDDPDLTILNQVLQDSADFPLDILGPFWAKEVVALAKTGAAPVDYAAAALLAIAGSVIGNARWVQVREGWSEPPILWCQVIGPPSASKSPAFRPLVKIMSDLEQMWLPSHIERHRQWTGEKKIADIKRKQWEAISAATVEKGENPPPMPADCLPPAEPQKRRAYLTDATLEALQRALAGNPRGFLNFRDEMSGWYSNLARYNSGSDRPAWLEAYGGGPYVIDRVKDNGVPVRIPHFSVGILGGIQPERLTDMLNSSDDGLQARFIPFWPENTIRPFEANAPFANRMREAIQRLSELTMHTADGEIKEPIRVPFSREALAAFGAWVNQRTFDERYVPATLSGAYGKAHGHVARIALILEMLWWSQDEFEDDAPDVISIEAVKCAIRFREEYIKPMQRRVYGHSILSADVHMAKIIATWIASNDIDKFNLRQMRREAGIRGISAKTDVVILEEAIAHLVQLKWIRPNRENHKEGRPAKDFIVNERLWEIID